MVAQYMCLSVSLYTSFFPNHLGICPYTCPYGPVFPPSFCPSIQLSVHPHGNLFVPIIFQQIPPSVCPSRRLSIHKSITECNRRFYLSVRPFPSICLSVQTSVHPQVHTVCNRCFYLSVRPSLHLSVRPDVCPSTSELLYVIGTFISPSVLPSICQSVQTSVHPQVPYCM